MAAVPAGGLTAQEPNDLAELVAWSDTVLLEESDDVINVVYKVDVDPAGGFLVADSREGQYRRYRSDGSLVWAFGQIGEGPEEFLHPLRALRLGVDGHVLLLDRRGKVAVDLDLRAGSYDRRIAVASRSFRAMTAGSQQDWASVAGRRRWAESQSYLTDIYPLEDGRFLVQFQTFRDELPVWGVMLVQPDGTVDFESDLTHRLLAVDGRTGLVVFQDVGALVGNRWLVGVLR